jgi:citrate lyase subunit beta / citryl-CoA lyase
VTLPADTVLRSLLYVGADDRDGIDAAFDAGADLVVVDLEDGVPADRKQRARAVAIESLCESPGLGQRAVRVNGLDSGLLDADLAALEVLSLDALALPKATLAGIEEIEGVGLPILAVVETAEGVEQAQDIARHPQVLAMSIGGRDLRRELELEARADGQELLHVRSRLVLASRAAGLAGPFDSVALAPVDDRPMLRTECLHSRSLGMRGRACVHPSQVTVVNEVFGDGSTGGERE